MAEKYEHENLGDVQDHVFIKATITAVDSTNDTAAIEGEGISGSAVPIFYHCEPDSEHRDNGAIYGAEAAFSVDDEVIVMCEGASGSYTPVRIVGFVDGLRGCCLFQDFMDNSYPWTDLGLVQDSFADGYPGLPRTISISATNASMGGTGIHSMAWDAALDFFNYSYANGQYAWRITLDTPMSLPITGAGLYWAVKYNSFSGAVNNYRAYTYGFSAAQSFFPFIEVVNNRGHYCRFLHDGAYPVTINTITYGTPNTYEINSSARISSSHPQEHADVTLRDPTTAYGNLYEDMLYAFMDITREWDVDAGVYRYSASNGAKYWIVGVGVLNYGNTASYGGSSEMSFDIERNSICPRIPPAEEGVTLVTAGTWYHFFNDPEKEYYIPRVSDEWPHWYDQAYQYEGDMPVSPIDTEFTPTSI